MKLHDHDISDDLSRDDRPAAAPAPGRTTRSQRLPPRGHVAPVQRASTTTPPVMHEDPFAMHLLGSSAPAGSALSMIEATPDQQHLAVAGAQLEGIADDARTVGRHVSGGARMAGDGCAALGALVGRSFTPVLQLSVLFTRATRQQAAADEDAETGNPLRMARAARHAAEVAPLMRAVDLARPVVFHALNELVRVSLQTIRRAGSSGADVHALAIALSGLSAHAAPMGWTSPADLEEANGRRFEQEACPEGGNDESPHECTMTDVQRVEDRREVSKEIDRVLTTFFDACDAEASALQAIIDADRDLGQLLGGMAIDIIASLITGGAGAVATRAARSVGSPGGAGDADLTKVVATFHKHVGKHATKAGMTKASGAANGLVEQARTRDAVDQLRREFRDAMDAVAESLETLDDMSLRVLLQTLRRFKASVATERVKAFAASYRSQVAPIGTEDPLFAQTHLHDRDLPARVTVRAARIHPLRGEARLALVRHVTDAFPSIRAAGRWAEGAIESAGQAIHDRADASDDGAVPDVGASTGGAARAAGATPGATSNETESTVGPGGDAAAEQFHFLRWIDADMASLAEGDALDLSAVVVHGVTWTGGANEDVE